MLKSTQEKKRPSGDLHLKVLARNYYIGHEKHESGMELNFEHPEID